MRVRQIDKITDNQIDNISVDKIEQPYNSPSSGSVNSDSVYFKITTLDGDTWNGLFRVNDLTQAIQSTPTTYLFTNAVGGLNEPGFVFTSNSNIFIWQGDNTPPSASSTIYSPALVSLVNANNSWQSLYGQTLSLFDDGNSTTDLSALNPNFQRVFGKGGTIEFSNAPLF